MIADIRNVSEVAVSPNGKDIAYLLRVPGNDAAGTQKSVLMTVPAAGGASSIILEKVYNPSSISWSRDSKNIYCLVKDSLKKVVQLNVVQLATKEVKPLTSGSNSILHYALSPDEKMLGLIYADPQTELEKADEKRKRDWIVKDANLKYDRLYVTDASASTPPKKLTDTNLHVTEFVWAPDGSMIYFKASQKTSVDDLMMYQKIYRVSAGGGTPEVVCETEGKLGNIDVSPDGKNLAFCGAVDVSDPLAQSVFFVSTENGAQKNLTEKFEGSAVEVRWINNTTILALTAEGCYSGLRKIDINTGKMTSIYSQAAIIRTLNFNPTNGVIAFSGSTPQNPNEVYAGTIAGGFLKKTDSNPELKGIKLTLQEVISWTGPDGWRIEGVLTYPADYKSGTKFPLLLQLHGGPEGVSANGWNTRSVYPVQWYAANGFFVLEPNYRGSQGRGVAFSKGDHKDLGGKEFDDVLAGIDYLVTSGMVDKNKVGTGGFSYGGYFSAWAGTKHSKRFKAAVMGAGISNWISFSGTTEIIHENSLVHWNLWWNENMDLVWDRSPIAHINDAQTPMLIIHGGADTRVPITQSEEMYNALKLKKVPTEMVVYKRQPHGLSEREAQIDYMNRTMDWFKYYVK